MGSGVWGGESNRKGHVKLNGELGTGVIQRL